MKLRKDDARSTRRRSARSSSRSETSVVPRALPSLGPGKKNFILGFEDCVCKLPPHDQARSVDELVVAISRAVEIPGAREWVNRLFEQGHCVCFFSPLPQEVQSTVRVWLEDHGFKFSSVIMNKPKALLYHYVDDRHVQATTFNGRFTPLIRKERTIEVFE